MPPPPVRTGSEDWRSPLVVPIQLRDSSAALGMTESVTPCPRHPPPLIPAKAGIHPLLPPARAAPSCHSERSALARSRRIPQAGGHGEEIAGCTSLVGRVAGFFAALRMTWGRGHDMGEGGGGGGGGGSLGLFACACYGIVPSVCVGEGSPLCGGASLGSPSAGSMGAQTTVGR